MSRRGRRAALAALLLLGPVALARAHDEAPATEPDRAPPPVASFAAPEPGSYTLPPIDRVSDHALLDIRGTPVPLLGDDRIRLVELFYTGCPESTGCPLATAVMKRVDAAIADDPGLRERVQLVSLSFDPARDTPERMATWRGHLAPRGDWRFLTASGPDAIAPVLDDFGQDVLPLTGPDAEPTGVLRHVLRVYLLDGQGRVRNVYSAGFLSAELVLADIRTLLLEGR